MSEGNSKSKKKSEETKQKSKTTADSTKSKKSSCSLSDKKKSSSSKSTPSYGRAIDVNNLIPTVKTKVKDPEKTRKTPEVDDIIATLERTNLKKEKKPPKDEQDKPKKDKSKKSSKTPKKSHEDVDDTGNVSGLVDDSEKLRAYPEQKSIIVDIMKSNVLKPGTKRVRVPPKPYHLNEGKKEWETAMLDGVGEDELYAAVEDPNLDDDEDEGESGDESESDNPDEGEGEDGEWMPSGDDEDDDEDDFSSDEGEEEGEESDEEEGVIRRA